MTADPHRVAVEVEKAIKALVARAKLAGVAMPEPWAREFIETLRHHGWSPCWPVTAPPPTPVRRLDPSRVTAMADEVRSVIRQKRASAPTDAEEQQ